MLREAYIAGFRTVIATSHYLEGKYIANRQQKERYIQLLQEILIKEKINIKVCNGSEVYNTINTLSLITGGIIATLNNSRYVLIELPMNQNNVYFEKNIYDLVSNGYIPIIAHPERYIYVQNNPSIVLNWIEQGSLLQSNYASMVDRYGHKAKKTLIKLLNANAIHFLGSDTHRPKNNYKQMDEILEEWKKVIDKRTLKLLSTKNPEKILDDERIIVEEPNEIKKHWFL